MSETPEQIDGDLGERDSILAVLEKAPALLAYRAKIVAEKDKAHRIAKHDVEVAKATARITYKEQRNADLIKAYCDADPVVKAAVRAEIDARALLEAARIEHQRIDDLFISARKVGGMDGREMAAIRGTTIAGSVVRDKAGNRVDSRTGEIVG